MAYGYTSGRTDPKVQSLANQPGGAARTNTGSPQTPVGGAPGTAPQFTSQTGSAVSPTGQITQTPAATGALAPAAAPIAAALAPAPAAPPVPPPTSPDPLVSMGGGVWNGVNWLPKNHPDAIKFLQTHPQATGGATGAAAGAQQLPGAIPGQPAQHSPYGAYPSTYNWQGSPVMDQMQQVVMQALGSPMFSADNISQMKGAAKDQAATMERDQMAQIAQNNAGRGTSGSGEQGADERRLMAEYGRTLTDNNRQIDLGAAQANREDMYNALGAGGAFTGQDEGLNQAAVSSALSSFFQNKGLDIQKLLGMEGIGAEREGNRLQAGSSILGSLLGYQNNNNQIGLGYSQLDAQQQNQLLARLLGGF